MNRKLVALVLGVLGVAATGCEKAARSPSRRQAMMMEATRLSGRASSYAMLTPAYAASPQRFVAEGHKIEIITPESELQKSWESVVAFCGTIHCEVISSSITTRTGDSVPSGTVALRVVPEDLKKLLEHVQIVGKIAQHTTEREDKTTAVVDTEAKIKNLTSFRDNLRAMLGKPSATVKDLVEIQQQLTETQSELDSETAQRKILANETEKIAVEISFRVERPGGNVGGFALIGNALRESGSVLADSTASLIYTIVTLIPWLILIVPGCWLLLRLWRKLRQRRNAPPSPPGATA
jgi:cob(I)alamin adenosyltransferase